MKQPHFVFCRAITALVLTALSAQTWAFSSVDEPSQSFSFKYDNIIETSSKMYSLPLTGRPEMSLDYYGRSRVPSTLFGGGWCLSSRDAFLNPSQAADEIELEQCGRITMLKLLASVSEPLDGKTAYSLISSATNNARTVELVFIESAKFDALNLADPAKTEKYKDYKEFPPNGRTAWLTLTIRDGVISAWVQAPSLSQLRHNNFQAVFDTLGRYVRDNSARTQTSLSRSYVGNTHQVDVIGYMVKRKDSNSFGTTIDYPLRKLSYDELGRVIRIDDLYSATLGKSVYWTLSYDKHSNLSSIQINKEPATHFGYDSRQRLSYINHTDQSHEAFFYDGTTERLAAYIYPHLEKKEITCFNQYSRISGSTPSNYKVIDTITCNGIKGELTEHIITPDKDGSLNIERKKTLYSK